jgi:DNA adenine methylase
MNQIIRPPIKYHGGKWYLKDWLISQFPSHVVYVEPFGGAGTVLLNKARCTIEVYNDIEYSVFNLMRVLRDNPTELFSEVSQIQYESDVYLHHKEIYLSEVFSLLSPLEQAVTTLVSRRMSRGGLCGTFSRSSRTLPSGVNAEVNAWLTAISNVLPLVSQRLQGVEIFNLDAIELMQKFDCPDTLFYLDPPYVTGSRILKKAYFSEMSDGDHRRLAEFVRCLRGRVILSGYPSPLYDELYSGWERCSRFIPNHSSHEEKKPVKTECVWRNFS